MTDQERFAERIRTNFDRDHALLSPLQRYRKASALARHLREPVAPLMAELLAVIFSRPADPQEDAIMADVMESIAADALTEHLIG